MLQLLNSSMLTNSAIFIFSLVVLAKASDTVVKSAVKISQKTGLDELAIGFLIVAISTSLPELVVSTMASLSNNMGIAVGNVFGSNIADICLILGLGALLYPTKTTGKMSKTLVTILFVTSFITIVLVYWPEVGRFFGLILLLIFLVFSKYSLGMKSMPWKVPKPAEGPNGIGRVVEFFRMMKDVMKSLLMFFLGVVFVIGSSHFVVSSASTIAELMGLAKSVLGATIIAIGTSLPELSVDLTALKKGRAELAFGDLLGSCIVNLTLVFGITLVLSPLKVNMNLFSDLSFFLLLSNISLWYFLDRGELSRKEGVALLALYILFLLSIFGLQISLLNR